MDGLGLVNLIVGKNGVGKTSLLEAIRFYTSGGDPRTVWELLSTRDEMAASPGDDSTRAAAGMDACVFRARFHSPDDIGATAPATGPRG